MKRLIIILLLSIVVLICGCISNSNTNNSENITKINAYLIYGPTCPHCEHLIKYIGSRGLEVVKTTNGKYADYLKQFGFDWDGGVPLFFAILKNDTPIIIEGYPSSSQDKNGYFFGMEYETKMCKNLRGTPIYQNGTYRYCKLPNGALVGNKYSVDYLINSCKKLGCKSLSMDR